MAEVLNARGTGWSDANVPPNAVYVGREQRWIGRAGRPIRFAESKWNNPFKTAGDYRALLTREPERAARVSELYGKDLICWCVPDKPCHAEVLFELVYNRPYR
jgi:hypothetical protein